MATLQSARSHYRQSSLVALRAAREALRARSGGPTAITRVVATHQVTQARLSQSAVAAMLAEQDIRSTPDAQLNVLAFTTSADTLGMMLDGSDDAGLGRLVASLVQDAGRSAESVATATRSRIVYTRYLSPPSCSRCAVLANRVYGYSSGFQRHPHCDCVMVPTTERMAHGLVSDPVELARQGLVTGLSKADAQAVADGADFNQIVNVRRSAAGLRESGRVLARAGRPTPEGIYRMSSSRTEAVALLGRFGYVL